MTPKEFDRLLRKTLAELPGSVRESIKNLEFTFLRKPTADLLEEGESCDDCDAFGLFVGPSLMEREEGFDPPTRIYVFGDAHEEDFPPEEVENAVRETLLHELGHYLGWEDDKLEELGL